MSKKEFWLWFVPILFACLWITLSVINAIYDDTPRKPSNDDLSVQSCISKGGVPIMDSSHMADCKL